MKILRIFFILLFFLIISVPISFTAFNINFQSSDIEENRALVSKNIIKSASVSDYPKQIEKYLNDNIAFRTQLIKIYHYIFAWHLYSPVANYIRINDEAYNLMLIKRYLDTPCLNHIPINEILNGMNFIANYHNCKFLYVNIPDKISVLENHLPGWMLEFKQRHYKPSFYEYSYQLVNKYGFANIDLITIFKESDKEIFAKRYDYNHYNHYGLDLSLKAISKQLNNISNKKFNSNDFQNVYFFNMINVNTVPRIGKYKSETIPYIYADETLNKHIKVAENPYGYTSTLHKWASTDYLINENNQGSINLLISSDSSFKALGMNIKIKGVNGKITPLIYGVNKYLHTFNTEYLNYDFLVNNIKFINADVYIYSITERQLPAIPKDAIFQIAGRYALGKNENFIFPEDIFFSSDEISSADIEINKNNKYVNINKQLITDKNGEIYISFRYKSPKKTNAILEYSANKDFSNSKRVSTQLNGGGEFRRCQFLYKI